MSQSDPPPNQERETSGSRDKRITARGRRSTALSRLADIRPGEGAAVLGSSLNLAGIVCAHVALETARDALFLTQLEPYALAFVYLAMAFLAALVGRFEHAVERILGRSNALILSLMFAAMVNTLFFVSDQSTALTFGFYLWVGLSGTLLMLQFWLFAAARFNTAQGRRLYGLVAAGGVLGAVAGGALSTVFTEWYQVESLLAVAAFIHLSTALLVTTAPPATNLPEKGRRASWSESIEEMKQSPYVRRLVVVSFLSTMTLLIVDYLFKSVSAARFSDDELGRFLAVFYTITNACALVIQVFIAMRILQRAGTIITLTLLPLALLLSTGAPLLFGGFLSAALLTKGIDGALRHSLHRVSMELLFLPLSASTRSSAKALIESLVARGTQGLTALLILALAATSLDRPAVLLALIAGGSVAWTLSAWSLRRHYLDQFRASIGRRAGPAFHLDELTLDGVEVVIESLSSPEENEVLSAMGLFERAGRTGLIPALLLYHPNEKIVIRALELIPSRHRRDWPPLAERLVRHDSSPVRLAAVQALGRYGYLDKLKPESFQEPPIAATAAFFLADQLDDPLSHELVGRIMSGEVDRSAQTALVQAIAEYGSPRWGEVLLKLRDAASPRLSRILPRAMIRVRDARFVPVLISRLTQREGAEEVREALAAIGPEAFSGLSEAMLSPDTDSALKMRIPQAIARFRNQRAADFLVDALHSSLPGKVRYKVLLALGNLNAHARVRYPHDKLLPLVEQNGREALRSLLLADFLADDLEGRGPSATASGTLLVSLLRDKHAQSLERITRLLQLLHRRENLRQVNYALRSEDSAARAAAGELLEVITLGYDEELREILRSLAEPSPGERYEHIVSLLSLPIENAVDALRDVLSDPDPALSALGADYAERAEVLEVAVEVQEVLTHNPWLNTHLGQRTERPPP